MHHAGAGHRFEQFTREVRRAAVAGRRHVDLVGIGLGVGDELDDGFSRKRRIDHHHVRHRHDAGDRGDVADEVEGQRFVEGRVDGVGLADQQDRVAVGRGVHHRFRRDVRRGTRAVFDDERLSQPIRQPLAHQAGDDVVAAARCVADDPAYRTRGPCLRVGPVRGDRQGDGARGEAVEVTTAKRHPSQLMPWTENTEISNITRTSPALA
jgi:hypothetical protein